MGELLKALNKPIDAFKTRNRWVAWGLVMLTILINSLFEPLLRAFLRTPRQEINFPHMLLTTVLGVCTYVTICALFWLVSKRLGSRTDFRTYIDTWGLTYFPTILCGFVVALTEVFFYVFWNNVIWGMVFNILFVGILIWKAVLYILYLREVAGLRQWKLIGAFLTIGMFIVLLALVDGYVGIKTPIL